MLFWFVISCLLFVACLIIFILLLVWKPKQVVNAAVPPLVDTRPGLPSGLGQSFVNTPDGTIALTSSAKPFTVLVTKDGPIKNAFVFSKLEELSIETVPTSRGFIFEVALPTSIVSLQVIDQLFNNGVRTVGIYRMTDRVLLYSTTISKANDVLLQGFRTHALLPNEQIPLVPGVEYALVGQVLVGDRYVIASNIAQPIQNVKMAPFFGTEGKVGFVASNSLALPSNFSSNFELTSPFASFQVQEKDVLQPVFDVDTRYARFPPNYILGFQLSVTDTNTCIAQRGLCNSSYNTGNILSQENILITTLPVKIADTWYAVYVADNSLVGTHNPQLVISNNASEIPDFPRQRRIGWARTKPESAEFFKSEQLESAVQRTTTYMENASNEFFIGMVNNSSTAVPLSFIPPNATECQLQFILSFPQPGTLPQNFMYFDIRTEFQLVVSTKTVRFFTNQAYQIQTLVIPIDSSLIPAQIIVQPHFDGAAQPDCTLNILQYVEDL